MRKTQNFLKDVIHLGTGTALAQTLIVLSAPLLTRLIPPESFGLAAFFFAFASIIGTASCLRYDQAIMLPESDQDARKLLQFSILICLATTASFAAAVFFNQDALVSLANTDLSQSFCLLLPVGALLTGVTIALNSWHTRNRRYLRQSMAKGSSALVTIPSQIGFAAAGHNGAIMLVTSQLAGLAASVCILIRGSSETERNDPVAKPRHLKDLLWRYRKFPQFSVASCLIGSFSSQLPNILLLSFFSPIVAGSFALSQRTLSLPINYISNAVAQVFYKRAAEANSSGGLSELTEQTICNLSFIALIPFACGAAVAPGAFTIIFGQEWTEAGIYARMLAPWMLLTFIVTPVSCLNNIFEKQHIGTYINITHLTLKAGSLCLGAYFFSPRLAIGLFSISSFLLVLYFGVYHLRLAGVSLARLCHRSMSDSIITCALLAPVFIAKWMYPSNNRLHLAIAVAICLLHGYRLFLWSKQSKLN